MIKKLIATLLLSASMFVAADGVLYSWTAPTQNVDGSVLTAEEIVAYSLRYSIDGVQYPNVIIAAGATEISIPGAAGEWTASIATMTAAGMSAYTDDLVTQVDAVAGSTPSAPTNLQMLIICDDLGSCTLEIK